MTTGEESSQVGSTAKLLAPTTRTTSVFVPTDSSTGTTTSPMLVTEQMEKLLISTFRKRKRLLWKPLWRRSSGVPDSDNDDEDKEEEVEDLARSNSLAKNANDDTQRSQVADNVGSGASSTAKMNVRQDREIDDGSGGTNDGEQGMKTEEFDDGSRDIADHGEASPIVVVDDPSRKEERTPAAQRRRVEQPQGFLARYITLFIPRFWPNDLNILHIFPIVLVSPFE
ncbi:hypothetical protein CAEBREN_19889 [Caenorhabditis brenneri]|uniref:Uncharacterized protein n=1 Tax=Caenorhabditis brenneri TaxID=135651 RepID=G0PDP9_CAEBE|nr:hypothetical protein CAEBREN_19889 [Caenorhabditis brenneri]